MTEDVRCPICVKKGREGKNVYRRTDGSYKCRTDGHEWKEEKK